MNEHEYGRIQAQTEAIDNKNCVLVSDSERGAGRFAIKIYNLAIL